MIYEDLRAILKTLTGPEELDIFDQAVVVLEDYNATDYLVAFEMTIGQWTDIDQLAKLDSLRSVIHTCMDYICQIQGVVLVHDLLLSDKLIITRALLDLVNYEDGEAIISRLNIESNNEETFAELMHLVSPWSVDVALSKVNSVEPGFATNIREFINGRNEKLEENAEEVQAQIKAYIQLKKGLDNKPLFADMFFAQVGSIGLPLVTYMKVFKDTVRDLDLRPMAQTAEDILSLAIASGDGFSTPLLSLRPFILQLYTDSKKQMDLDHAVKQLITTVSAKNEQT